MNYCPECGSKLSMSFVAGRERPVCPTCGFVYYRNPAPVVLVSVTRDGRLLHVRRLIEPLKGYWAPPGGYVEYDETVEDAAVREVKEETNLDIVIEGLLNVYSRPDTGIVFIAYRGRVAGGEPQAGEDAGDVAFFGPDELPDQPPPAGGTELDRWSFQVISDIVEDFRKRGGA
ncbi:MAG: NUDIX domain-containing protein [Chloroflexi bacterium]|nr:MAG: NUDIX domain-containing protein [Chloroflexota bacterium]